MLITVYNIQGAAATALNLDMPLLTYQVKTTQFPHVLAPIAYTVAIIIWIISLNIGFTSDFYAGFGFYLADFTTAATYAIAVHHMIFFKLFEEKSSESLIIP